MSDEERRRMVGELLGHISPNGSGIDWMVFSVHEETTRISSTVHVVIECV